MAKKVEVQEDEIIGGVPEAPIQEAVPVEMPQEPSQEASQEEPQGIELTISVDPEKGIGLNIPEGKKKMEPDEIENLLFIVHKHLYEQRIAKLALDMFKQRLG